MSLRRYPSMAANPSGATDRSSCSTPNSLQTSPALLNGLQPEQQNVSPSSQALHTQPIVNMASNQTVHVLPFQPQILQSPSPFPAMTYQFQGPQLNPYMNLFPPQFQGQTVYVPVQVPVPVMIPSGFDSISVAPTLSVLPLASKMAQNSSDDRLDDPKRQKLDEKDDDALKQKEHSEDESGGTKSVVRVKGAWTGEEDALLKSLVGKFGTKWSVVASHLPGRIGKQCRERWLNHLDGRIKRTPWTPEEDAILLDARKVHGSRWCHIAKLLPGRAENTVKNRCASLLNKFARSPTVGKNEDSSASRSPPPQPSTQTPSSPRLPTLKSSSPNLYSPTSSSSQPSEPNSPFAPKSYPKPEFEEVLVEPPD